MRLRKTALLVLFVSTAALAAPKPGGGKPPPPPATSNPDIGFVKISGGVRRLYELRVANEDGMGAATIYSSRDTGQMVPHMGPRNQRTILLIQGSKVSLVTYEPTSTGTQLKSIEALPGIGTAPGAQTVAFSPDGSKFVSFAQNDMSFWVFDIATRTFSPLLQLAATPHHFAFSRDGSAIVYLDHVSDTDAILKSVPLAGGTPIELGIRGDFWHVEPAHQSDGYVLVRGVDVTTSRIEYHPADGSGPFDLAQGYAPSLKCDDSTVIYQRNNSSGGVSLLRYNLASNTGNTTSAGGNYWPDYVGCDG